MRTLRKLNSDTEGKIRTAPTFRYWPVSDGRAVCPLWVKLRSRRTQALGQLCPYQRTSSTWRGTSDKCQKATSGLQFYFSFAHSLTILRQSLRIKLEVVSMALDAELAVSIRVTAGASLLLVLTAPVLACRGTKHHKILLDAVLPAAEEAKSSLWLKSSRCRSAHYRDCDPFMWLAHASRNQSEASRRTDRSNRCRGDHVRWWTRSERGWTQGFHRWTLPPDRR